ncbi:MAG: UDP-N-acetylglucosamine 1-carboxyvinyltransferase [Candidatus Levybacteria bacterium RIFCSPLOWO2_02_FULL_36_8b]|nr:MAG: UDP-N-acetylglucosamine 1-carboxyvinyltransferase [Candidatus Levybacteria bacterium RIFCSPLOWO2_02_FULL_36_8b]
MEKFIVVGGKKLKGKVSVSGAKNVALKAIVAACLTSDEVIIENVPLISDFFVMTDIVKELGGDVKIEDHKVYIRVKEIKNTKISLEKAAEIRTSSMFLAPLLARKGVAVIPNPGGCRIGARPIDRVIDGFKKMGVNIVYKSRDGYFHANTSIEGNKLKGAEYEFEKNTHTGTEILILAAVTANRRTVLKNAAQEPEIDELVNLLNKMGAKIKRTEPRVIVIDGVEKLHGTNFIIGPDRNEVVTFAIAAVLTNGDIFVKNADKAGLIEFLNKFEKAGGGFEVLNNGIRFYAKGELKPVDIITTPYPGFMTDWQGPWAVLMTKAKGISIIHEAVYENRFGYVDELKKMGADIELFNPKVDNAQIFYNFNIKDDKKEYLHAEEVKGPVNLHNAVMNISDLRAGATLVLAALCAFGESVIFGVEHLDRGYEKFEERLKSLGADIKRVSE